MSFKWSLQVCQTKLCMNLYSSPNMVDAPPFSFSLSSLPEKSNGGRTGPKSIAVSDDIGALLT